MDTKKGSALAGTTDWKAIMSTEAKKWTIFGVSLFVLMAAGTIIFAMLDGASFGQAVTENWTNLVVCLASAQVCLKSWRRIWFQTCHVWHEEPYAPPTLRGIGQRALLPDPHIGIPS